MKNLRTLAVILTTIAILTGCVSISGRQNVTELFKNADEMVSKHDAIIPGSSTVPDLEKLGILLSRCGKEKNMSCTSGVEAYKTIFGHEAYNSLLASILVHDDRVELLDKMFVALARYRFISFQDERTKETEITIPLILYTRKSAAEEGRSASIQIALRDDLVIYKGKKDERIDRRKLIQRWGISIDRLLERAADKQIDRVTP